MKRQKNIGLNLVILGIFSYLIVYIFFGSQPYGWYTFPFWTLLTILLANFISKGIVKARNIIAVFFILLTILGFNISRIIGIFEFQPYANLWRIGISGIIFILVIKQNIKFKNTYFLKILFLIFFGAIIYTNYKYLDNLNLDYWWQNIS